MDKDRLKGFFDLERGHFSFCLKLIALSLVGFLLNCIPIYYYGASEEAVSLVGLLFTHLAIISGISLGADCASGLFHNLVGFTGSHKIALRLSLIHLWRISVVLFLTTCAVLGMEVLLFGIWSTTIPNLVINDFVQSIFWYVLLILPSGVFGAVISALYQKHGNLVIVVFVEMLLFVLWLFPSEVQLFPVISYFIAVICFGYKAIMTVDLKEWK